MNSKRIVLILVVSVPVCLLVVVAALFLSTNSSQTRTNSTKSSTSSGGSDSATSETNSSQNPLANFAFAGIRNNDTVILTADREAQVVVQLDTKQWQTPKWQPQRKVLAVLGNSGTIVEPIYNIFTFDPSKNVWQQITSYDKTTSGVTAFNWLNNTTLSFTQGAEGNNWLHNLDYVNSQLTKVFQTEGKLMDDNSASYVFVQNNNVLRWHDIKGKELIKYNAGDIEAGAKIIQSGLNNQDQAWMLVQTTNQQIMYIFATAGNIVPTEILRVRLGAQTILSACEIGSNFFFIQSKGNTLQILNLANTNQPIATLPTNQEITKLNSQVTCTSDSAYIRIYGGESNQWYRFTGSRLETLPGFANLDMIAAL